MARARVWCEVACSECGVIIGNSRYYKNAHTITSLKEQTRDWIWDDEICGNVCPACQEARKKPEEVNEAHIDLSFLDR